MGFKRKADPQDVEEIPDDEPEASGECVGRARGYPCFGTPSLKFYDYDIYILFLDIHIHIGVCVTVSTVYINCIYDMIPCIYYFF